MLRCFYNVNVIQDDPLAFLLIILLSKAISRWSFFPEKSATLWVEVAAKELKKILEEYSDLKVEEEKLNETLHNIQDFTSDIKHFLCKVHDFLYNILLFSTLHPPTLCNFKTPYPPPSLTSCNYTASVMTTYPFNIVSTELSSKHFNMHKVFCFFATLTILKQLI